MFWIYIHTKHILGQGCLLNEVRTIRVGSSSSATSLSGQSLRGLLGFARQLNGLAHCFLVISYTLTDSTEAQVSFYANNHHKTKRLGLKYLELLEAYLHFGLLLALF